MKQFLYEIIVSLILVLGFYLNSTGIIMIALSAFIVKLIVSNHEKKISTLFYFVSWALVMKIDMNSTSFYTVGLGLIILLMIFDLIIVEKKFDKPLFILCFGFGGYVLITNLLNDGGFDFPLKFFMNCLLFLYAFLYMKTENLEKYVLAYSLGVLSSGVTGLFLDSLGNMSSNIEFDTLMLNGQIINRFVGLNWDPNFFGLQVITSISLLLMLNTYFHKLSYIFYSGVLGALGFMTVSKTYIIILLILVSIYISFILFRNIQKNKTILTIFLAAVVFVVIKFEELFSLYAIRLNDIDTNGNLNSITTGRVEIWESYINKIFSSLKTLFLGVGIENGSASHNLYISSIYLFGLIGIVIFVILIFRFYKVTKLINYSYYRSLINYVPVVITSIYFLSLDGILELYFFPQLILLVMAMNYGISINSKVKPTI
jgi:hypothetical protein